MATEQESPPEFVEIQVESTPIAAEATPEADDDHSHSHSHNHNHNAAAVAANAELRFEALERVDADTEQQIADVAGRALAHSGLATFLLSADGRQAVRVETLKWLASWLVRTGERCARGSGGEAGQAPVAYVLRSGEGRVRAVAVALPKEEDESSAGGGAGGVWAWAWAWLLLRVGPTSALRVYAAWDQMHARWAGATPQLAGRYLPLVCVDPAFQGRGLLGTLVGHIRTRHPAQPLLVEVHDARRMGSLRAVCICAYADDLAAGPPCYVVDMQGAAW